MLLICAFSIKISLCVFFMQPCSKSWVFKIIMPCSERAKSLYRRVDLRDFPKVETNLNRYIFGRWFRIDYLEIFKECQILNVHRGNRTWFLRFTWQVSAIWTNDNLGSLSDSQFTFNTRFVLIISDQLGLLSIHIESEAAIEGVQASVDTLKLLSGGWCLK